MRQVAIGLSNRPDLMISAAAHRDDKDKLNEVAESALEASQSSAKSNIGTALHRISERIDQGQPTGLLPEIVIPDIEAYRIATAQLKTIWVERLVVNDELRVAGTPDRVVELDGTRFIGDLKGLALDTKIPTPHGWSTIGELKVGDKVFDSQGNQCNIIVKSAVKNIGTYIVSFDDGTKIVCDSEHIWWTQRKDRGPAPIGMSELIRTLRYNVHKIPIAGALNLPEFTLDIDPYLLGCWLGDGSNRSGRITKEDALFDILESDGSILGTRQEDNYIISRTIIGLTTKLRRLGLLSNKHIPKMYLRASFNQRLRLLQGLMDTDGTWNIARQTAVFNSTSKELAYNTHELILSLGCRSHIAEYTTKGFGLTVTAYTVEFIPTQFNPFRLPRKRDRVRITKRLGLESRRTIRSIETGFNAPTVCIGVDSPDSTYLCSESMIPTHNTSQSLDLSAQKFAMQMAIYSRSVFYNYKTQEREPIEGVSQDYGIVVHLPSGSGTCQLYWIDLNAGYWAVQLATYVREWRKRKDLLMPFTPELGV
jgi:replicative DNA helicase